MKSEVERKLNKIFSIWNNFIWDYKFCSDRIKFDAEVKTNYCGDILGYFKDTFEIAFSQERPYDNLDKFSFTISLLQGIYVQQDLTEELLNIFKAGIERKLLRNDPNYSINREIRNELVGHPISRDRDKKLISSTLFSYQSAEDEIEYSKYSKENNFKFEVKAFKILDIQKRHEQFLNTYFDIILKKLETILDDFLEKLDYVEDSVAKENFTDLLELVELYFEAFFKSDYIYDKSSLLTIYGRRNEHRRYQNFIDKCYKDLESELSVRKDSIRKMFAENVSNKVVQKSINLPDIKKRISPASKLSSIQKQPVSYIYEISKIGANVSDFRFFGGMLKRRCAQNELVVRELDHMESNIADKIEYYSSLALIQLELDEDESNK